jgi:hypothetical protein
MCVMCTCKLGFGGAAQELRNPLQVIASNLELLSDKFLDPDQAECVRELATASSLMVLCLSLAPSIVSHSRKTSWKTAV